MIAWKSALMGLTALVSASASPYLEAATDAESGIPAMTHPEVVRVLCLGGSGTAFRVGPNLFLSVDHVTGPSFCTIDNRLVKVHETQGDFSVVSNGSKGPWLTIDCGGFVKGRKYRAIGYARGLDTLTDVEVTATGETLGGFAALKGLFTVIPGQSGGPIVDTVTGKAVGTINVYNAPAGLSGSRELRGTPVCKSVAGRA